MLDDTEGSRIAVTRLGRGRPVRVLLHGFASNSGTFQNLLPFLHGKGCAVLIDLPGHGRSDVPGFDPLPHEMALAIVRVIRSLHLESFHLIGHSLGGLVAAHVASLMPSQVEKLFLISCAGVGPMLDLSFFRAFLAADSTDNLLPYLATAYAHPPSDLSKVSRNIFTWLEKPMVRAYVGKIVESADTFSAELEMVVSNNVPVSALWGATDSISPLVNARFLPPQISLKVLEGIGHVPHIEAPSDVARWLIDEGPSDDGEPHNYASGSTPRR